MTYTQHQLQILYEDNHIIVVNKKVGDLVQGDKTGDKPLAEMLKDYIKVSKNKPGKVFLGVVHRLDRPTSGVVIFTRTSKALSRFSEMFRKKEVKKTYWAIVKNRPDPTAGTIKSFLKKNPKNNKSTAYDKPIPGSKESILHYTILKYRFDRSNADGGIHLHARQVEFIHPVSKERLHITAPTPKDPLWDACS
jgi:23S rRNA pseudouridine1911/1915/1917 synthase